MKLWVYIPPCVTSCDKDGRGSPGTGPNVSSGRGGDRNPCETPDIISRGSRAQKIAAFINDGLVGGGGCGGMLGCGGRANLFPFRVLIRGDGARCCMFIGRRAPPAPPLPTPLSSQLLSFTRCCHETHPSLLQVDWGLSTRDLQAKHPARLSMNWNRWQEAPFSFDLQCKRPPPF